MQTAREEADKGQDPKTGHVQAMVVLIRPALESKEIFPNSSPKAGLSNNLSFVVLEQRGEWINALM